MAEEGLKKTENDLIHIGCPIPFDVHDFLQKLEHLMEQAYQNEAGISKTLEQIVSTFHPQK